jgi:hypothetical protein
LGSGEFDEIESHNSFLEALNAWRGVNIIGTPAGTKNQNLHGSKTASEKEVSPDKRKT